jgi:hypothetical protein
MKYEIFDIEPVENVFQRIVNIELEEGSGLNFPADMQNESYVKFLNEQGLTDREVQALKPGTWYDMQEPASLQSETIQTVEEITENGTE